MRRPVPVVVWEARVWILAIALVATLGASLYGARQPKVYAARATILAPKEGQGAALAATIGSLLDSVGGGGSASGGVSALLGGAASTTTADLFMILLRSRTLRERVGATMAEKYGPGVDNVVVSVLTETRDPGSLGLTVEATDPALAAAFANEYFAELDRTLERQSEQKAQREKTSYASQLERAAREVAVAEQAVLAFQTRTRLLGTLEGTENRDIDIASGMRGAIQSAEQRRAVLGQYVTPEHPEARDLDKEITGLKELYSRLVYGEPMDLQVDGKGTRKEFFVPTAQMTPIQMELVRLLRNVTIQEMFYTRALGGLEDVQYARVKPPTRVVFVDRAEPPPRPVRPSLPIIVTAAIVGSLVSGALLSVAVDRLYERRMANAGAVGRSDAVAARTGA